MIKILNLVAIPLIILIGTGCSKTTDIVCIPTPLYPDGGDTVDNGTWRDSCQDYIKWTFQWSECPGASNYNLYVINENAINPVIDFMYIGNSSFDWVDSGWIPGANLNGWKWRVRARIDREWGEWSEWRTFTVEAPDFDC